MSYRRAWLLLRSLNESLVSPATLAAKGGRGGGGATVTPTGLKLIRNYRRVEANAAREVSRLFAAFARTASVVRRPARH